MIFRSKLLLLLTMAAQVLLGSPALAADERRWVLAVGDDVGLPEDPPLRFAARDATRFAEVLVEVGDVPSGQVRLLLNQPASTVLREIDALREALAASGVQSNSLLFVYISSHAKAGVLHLQNTRLALDELRKRISTIRTTVRLVIVDACDSGMAARKKGAKLVPDYQVQAEKLPLKGDILLSSSGPAQAAQEHDALGGSLFTYHLIAGLRGDADSEPDGRVSLNEAYSYAYRRTVFGSQYGAQTPLADLDVVGSGDLILSQPKSASTALIFPAESSGEFLVASKPRMDVMFNVEKRPGKPLRLAIPSGRYVVEKRDGATVKMLGVELPYGGEQFIDESQMVKRHFAEVALKGGSMDFRSSRLFLTGGYETPPLVGGKARPSPGIGYFQGFGSLWTMLTLDGAHTSLRGINVGITEWSTQGTLELGYRFLDFAIIPMVGLGVGVVGRNQSFLRDQEEQIAAVFGPAPNRQSLGVHGILTAGVEIPIAGRFSALVLFNGLVRYQPQEGTGPWSVGARGRVALAVAF